MEIIFEFVLWCIFDCDGRTRVQEGNRLLKLLHYLTSMPFLAHQSYFRLFSMFEYLEGHNAGPDLERTVNV